MRQDLINLYDRYTHGTMLRRDFLTRLAKLAGGAAAAAAVLPLLENNYAQAAIVPEDDARLSTGMITLDLATGPLQVYRAVDKDNPDGRPSVLVIHENRGLNPHIKDVARRFALEGFCAMAVDMLSPVGGTPDDSDEARKMIYALNADETVARLSAAVDFLNANKAGPGHVGAVGYCWGGGMVNALAVHNPALKAGVAYYGRQADAADAARIKAAMMLHYAGLDERINAGIDAYKAALEAGHVEHQVFIYDGVNHAFNNDTNEARYNAEAANLAWGRTVAFFKEKLA